jgi:hypothetical protein
MNWIESQRIHRAFTTAMVTGKTWKHNLSDDQLFTLKFLTPKEQDNKMKEWTEPEFEILDRENFPWTANLINEGIHKYEPWIESTRAKELVEAGHDEVFVTHQFNTKDINGVNCKDVEQLNVTAEELSKSFIGNYLEYDVFMHSYIFGKSYIETYVEDALAMEFDVTNVSNIIGDFQVAWGVNNVGKKSYFHKSKWLHWIREHLLPDYLTHPVPLGKLVGWNKPPNPGDLNKHRGIPSILWEP